MYQFSYRPPEEKRSQKKSQQSQEVWAVLKYTCYLLLCLLDLWSTFEGLIKLKQIPFLIYSPQFGKLEIVKEGKGKQFQEGVTH